jgi:hypothetical protein
MKDAPAIIDPAGWAKIFRAALASAQHRAGSPARRRVDQPWAFMFVTDHFSLAS